MTHNNPMMAQMIQDPQFMQMAMQMMQNPQMMQALGGMRSLTSGNTEGTQQPTGMGGGANPMAAMMQDPAMMQAMMQMMGGAGGAGGAGMPGAGGAPGAPGANPFAAMMGGMPAATPARCACGNFESGRGDGLCNACRNSGVAP